jgi:hypothetical protein
MFEANDNEGSKNSNVLFNTKTYEPKAFARRNFHKFIQKGTRGRCNATSHLHPLSFLSRNKPFEVFTEYLLHARLGMFGLCKQVELACVGWSWSSLSGGEQLFKPPKTELRLCADFLIQIANSTSTPFPLNHFPPQSLIRLPSASRPVCGLFNFTFVSYRQFRWRRYHHQPPWRTTTIKSWPKLVQPTPR